MPQRSLKSFIPFASLFLVIATSAFSQQPVAVVEETEGTVEIRLPGEQWQTVDAGDAVPLEATVSTGFGAEARLALGENTVVRIEPLTRVTIDELAVNRGVERSEMNLEIGRVQGDVIRSSESPTQFQVRSSIATASVRGTSFSFDGEELAVSEGVVAFVSAIGRQHSVSAGEQNFTYDIADQPDAPAAARVSRRSVSHMTTMR